MWQLIVRRSATLIPTAFLGSVMLFLLVQFVPGGVAASIAGAEASPELLAKIEQDLGLDRPIIVQYGEWLGRILFQGDFGVSLIDRRSVSEAMLTRMPITFELSALALVISLLVGVPLGVLAATRRQTPIDAAITGVSGLGQALPEFWLAMIAVNLFALQWAVFPATGIVPIQAGLFEHLRSIALPVLTLSSGAAAVVTRFTRSGMLEALASSYTRTAISLGLPRRRILFQFALRNALIPVITVVGILAGGLIGGAVLVEQVFVIPGIGTLFVTAVQQKDYPTVQGVAILLISIVVLINLIVDIACGILDPRIRT